jgi:hypothetical protein
MNRCEGRGCTSTLPFLRTRPQGVHLMHETAKTINRDLYEDMVAKGIEYVEERFGYKKIIDSFVDIVLTF